MIASALLSLSLSAWWHQHLPRMLLPSHSSNRHRCCWDNFGNSCGQIPHIYFRILNTDKKQNKCTQQKEEMCTAETEQMNTTETEQMCTTETALEVRAAGGRFEGRAHRHSDPRKLSGPWDQIPWSLTYLNHPNNRIWRTRTYPDVSSQAQT